MNPPPSLPRSPAVTAATPAASKPESSLPGIPSVSKKDSPAFHDAAHRQHSAAAFETGARAYDDVRPGYLPEALDLLGDFDSALDLGCGTGKLTVALRQRCPNVIGLDPSADMLRELGERVPGTPRIQARAESIPLADHSIEVATCAQTWHWLDPLAASAELARVTVDSGRVLLVWNTLDVLVPWVHRLSRIMHSGDTLREGFMPTVGPEWKIARTLRTRWEQQLLPQEIHTLTHTRSYWLRANEKTRARLTMNLDWYLYDHLGLDPRAPLKLPYRLDAFLLSKR